MAVEILYAPARYRDGHVSRPVHRGREGDEGDEGDEGVRQGGGCGGTEEDRLIINY